MKFTVSQYIRSVFTYEIKNQKHSKKFSKFCQKNTITFFLLTCWYTEFYIVINVHYEFMFLNVFWAFKIF